MLEQKVSTLEQVSVEKCDNSSPLDIDELAKKWIELLFSSINKTEDIELGNDYRVCKDKVEVKRKVSPPRK
jgi:hypothetical protein